MGTVAILRGEKPNKLATAANRADAPWFAANPDRQHFLRRALPIERLQALCLHGQPQPFGEWCIAARRLEGGLTERRFYSSNHREDGKPLDGSSHLPSERAEALAQVTFERALIAGERPRA